MDDARDERPDDDADESHRREDRAGRGGSPIDPEDLDIEADEDDDEDLDEDFEGERDEITIEIRGLSLYTHHGVSAAEREIGQRLLVDLRMAVVDCDAVVTDQVADTIDYGEVCQLVALVAQQRSYKTLERLCAAIADRIVADYGAEEVWVKCTKPEPPIPLAVEEVSVELWRAGDGG